MTHPNNDLRRMTYSKSSLVFYGRYKTDIQETEYNENDEATTILIYCQRNTLKLTTKNRHMNYQHTMHVMQHR